VKQARSSTSYKSGQKWRKKTFHAIQFDSRLTWFTPGGHRQCHTIRGQGCRWRPFPARSHGSLFSDLMPLLELPASYADGEIIKEASNVSLPTHFKNHDTWHLSAEQACTPMYTCQNCMSANTFIISFHLPRDLLSQGMRKCRFCSIYCRKSPLQICAPILSPLHFFLQFA
jgi:hypothetical protein